MFIFNSFSVGFSSLCHSFVFDLCIFFFRKTKKFYVSAMKRLRQGGKKSNVNKIMRTYLLCMNKGGSSVDEKITRNINKLRSFMLRLWDV